jgi:hypothetical protein
MKNVAVTATAAKHSALKVRALSFIAVSLHFLPIASASWARQNQSEGRQPKISSCLI